MTPPHAPDDLAGLPFWLRPPAHRPRARRAWGQSRVAWIDITLSAYEARHDALLRSWGRR